MKIIKYVKKAAKQSKMKEGIVGTCIANKNTKKMKSSSNKTRLLLVAVFVISIILDIWDEKVLSDS